MSVQPPPHSQLVRVSFPADHIVILCLNRPRALNAMSAEMEEDLRVLLNWFNDEPSLWVVVVTGEGSAFCAGADLKSWNARQQQGGSLDQERIASNAHGFGSISRRIISKPIIAAVNGGAFGGGVELILNCDLVIACDEAVFALPEVKRGVVAAQGVIPRLRNTAGHQAASEMLLLGRTVSAVEAYERFGFVNLVVSRQKLLPTAIEWAQKIVQNSPDAVQCTKKGLIVAAQSGNVDRAVLDHAWSSESKVVYSGENIKEGLRAFSEKRLPRWSNPAKL